MEATTIKIAIGNREVTFHLIETNATREYDYGYVIVLYEGDNSQRFLLVPDESLAHQEGRNRSGMYTFIPSGEIDEAAIIWELWAHMMKYDWTA